MNAGVMTPAPGSLERQRSLISDRNERSAVPRRAALLAVVLAVATPLITLQCASRQVPPAARALEPAAPPSATELRIGEALHKPVSFDFIATPFDDVVSFFHNLMKVNIVLDKRAIEGRETDVTLKVENVEFGAALIRICDSFGLVCTVKDDAILITTPEKLRAMQATPTAVLPKPEDMSDADRQVLKIMQKKVTFDFFAIPLDDVVSFFHNLLHMNIALDEKVLEGRNIDVTLRLEHIEAGKALAHLCRQNNLVYTIKDDVLLITTRERLRAFEQAPVALLPKPADMSDAEKQILEILRRRISFDFIATPLEDITAFWHNLLHVNIVLDRKALEGRSIDVSVKLEAVRFSSALAYICREFDLVYTIKDDAIFITTRENLSKPK